MDVGHARGVSRADREARVGQVDAGYRWQDLVLPQEELERLRAISSRLRGDDRHISGERASIRRMSVLFLGAAGTGKTMAAQILAGETGRPVHTLDLAAALTRAGPEVEQVAAQACESAAGDGAILVIDGAGGLLRRPASADWRRPGCAPADGPGDDKRRTEASGHDAAERTLWRLLRCTDDFDGLVIVTSTVTHGIDPAVTDRFHAVVTLPLPDTTARKEIWRRSLPADAQLTDGNIEYLAGWLHWTGGTIDRCCAAAATEAAREGVPVHLRHVAHVLGQGYRTGGHPVPTTAPPLAAVRSGAGNPQPAAVRSGAGTRPPPGDPSDTPISVLPGPSGRRWLLATVVVAVAVVIAGIVALTSAGTVLPGARRTAFVDAVRVLLPSSWRESANAPQPSRGIAGELVIVAPAPAPGELVLGRMAQGDASPLPQNLLATLPSPVTPQIVKVGRRVFYRYLGSSSASGSAAQSIYAMPTTAGTVIGVCRPRAGSSFTSSCERVLGTLQLTTGRALPLTLSTSYARQLNSVIGRLNAARSHAGPRLATAGSAHAQAAAATQLAAAQAQAASALGHLDAGVATAANAALAHALLLAADAYRALAHAAARGDAPAYRRARADLARSAQALTLAFGQLKRLGYRVA